MRDTYTYVHVVTQVLASDASFSSVWELSYAAFILVVSPIFQLALVNYVPNLPSSNNQIKKRMGCWNDPQCLLFFGSAALTAIALAVCTLSSLHPGKRCGIMYKLSCLSDPNCSEINHEALPANRPT